MDWNKCSFSRVFLQFCQPFGHRTCKWCCLGLSQNCGKPMDRSRHTLPCNSTETMSKTKQKHCWLQPPISTWTDTKWWGLDQLLSRQHLHLSLPSCTTFCAGNVRINFLIERCWQPLTCYFVPHIIVSFYLRLCICGHLPSFWLFQCLFSWCSSSVVWPWWHSDHCKQDLLCACQNKTQMDSQGLIQRLWWHRADSVTFRIDFLPKVCYSYYSAAAVPSSFVCHCQLSNLIWLSLNSSFCKSKLAPSNGAASFVSLWWGRILPPRCLEWAMCLLLLLLLLLMSMMVLHQSCCVCYQGVLPRTAESYPILV